MSDNNVHSIVEARLLSVPEEDMELVRQAMATVHMLQAALGAEYERHMNEAGRIKHQIDLARREYASLVDMLAKKHVRRPGKFTFQPETGTFVEQETP